MLNAFISRIKCVHFPLSICGFSGMFFCGALANFLETVVLVSISLLYLHVAYQSIHTEVESIETSIRQGGLRLVYYKQRLRRLSANKRKLVWKVLQTRLTLFVFSLYLSFGWWHPKIKFSSTCFGNIKYKTKKTVLIVILFFSCTLVRWFILFCTVAWPDSNHTRAFITQHSV